MEKVTEVRTNSLTSATVKLSFGDRIRLERFRPSILKMCAGEKVRQLELPSKTTRGRSSSCSRILFSFSPSLKILSRRCSGLLKREAYSPG